MGGGDWFYQVTPEGKKGQKGILGANGLNNIGLLVRTWGRVVQTGTNSFVIDDGSGALPEVAVPAGTTLPSEDDIVTVTGVSSCKKVDGNLYRVVRVEKPEHIVYIVKH